MAFQKKEWVNRQSEYPNRRILTRTGNADEYEITRSEGLIVEEGDPLDADNLNDLEKRIEEGFLSYDTDGNGVVDNADNGMFTYTHSAGTLEGSGANGKFKATVTETVSSITVNGTSYPVLCAGENEMELVAGSWYTFVFDGEAVNFRGGGGLTNSKLALATAGEADVLAGETFYSGDKVLKTGTIAKKEAATYGAKTSDQTIAAGQYLNGAQKIAKVTHTNLSAANIKKGVNVKVTSNGSDLWNITGTATDLNFTVVGGTSQPSSPAANTIWVNTSTTITDYVFSATQPSGATGRVWIKTSGSSTGTFDAVNTNVINVYPNACYQWNGSAFVIKTALIYQSGTWINFGKIYLYNNGDLCSGITGGWNFMTSYTCSQQSTYLQIGRDSQAYTAQAIDLTGVTSINFLFNSIPSPDNTPKLAVATSGTTTSFTASVGSTTYNANTYNVTYTLDVSSLTGKYYVILRNQGWPDVQALQVWIRY